MGDYNILIVGTDPSVIGLLNIHLEEEGYFVTISDNTLDAWSYVERKKFDVIVLDTSELGTDLHTRIRSHPKTSKIPFILLNAWGGEAGIQPGPRDYIVEHIDVEEIVRKVKGFLQVSGKSQKLDSKPPAKSPQPGDLPIDLPIMVEDWVVFKGHLEKISIHEIMRGLSLMGKSGQLLVVYGNRKGLLSFMQGHVIHAAVGNLKGEKGIYRLLLWRNGQFLFDPQTPPMVQNVRTPTETLVMECARRLEQYKPMLARLPPLETRVESLSLSQYKTLSVDEIKIVNIVNRQPTLLSLIESSPLEDATTLEILIRLYAHRVIGQMEEEEVSDEKTAPKPEPPAAALEGNLKEINIGEIIQILILIRKDGRLLIGWEDRKGEVYLQNGNITYATVEHLKGESAVYRLLTWREGKFRFDTGVAVKSRNVQKSLESIFFEGLDVLEKYKRFMEQFPSLNAYVEVISVTGQEKITSEEAKLLKIVNECETLNDVIHRSPFGDLKTLEILARLYSDRIIGISKGAPDKKSRGVDYNQIADDLFG